MIKYLPLNCTWLYENKYTPIELFQVDIVIEPCTVTFIQSNSNQIIGMHGAMRTNRLWGAANFSRHDVRNSIIVSTNFAEVHIENHWSTIPDDLQLPLYKEQIV